MFDIGWTELLIIGVVALIVVGPKDLPVMFRTLGQFTGKLRSMAREFTRAMDDAADQAGAKDIARDLRNMANPRSAATKSFKKAAGLDDIQKSIDGLMDDEVEDEGARDTSSKSHGSHTKALSEQRAAEAKARREDAVRRANERSASYEGFDGASTPTSGVAATEPGGAAPATEHASEDAERGKV